LQDISIDSGDDNEESDIKLQDISIDSGDDNEESYNKKDSKLDKSEIKVIEI
jgi:hypothetical protein